MTGCYAQLGYHIFIGFVTVAVYLAGVQFRILNFLILYITDNRPNM